MIDACIQIRDALLERRGLPQSAEVAAHLEGCGECAGFARRAALVAQALASLPYRRAPRELDGLAVAALEAGHRQDRVVNVLRTLPRAPVPDELAHFTLDLHLRTAKAPSVLDRLVEEDLRNQGAALSRRFAWKLERRPAPKALRERLERGGLALAGANLRRRAPLLAAALAVLLTGGGLWLFQSRAGNEDFESYFEVHRETSLESMDPMARSLLSGLSGGLVQEQKL